MEKLINAPYILRWGWKSVGAANAPRHLFCGATSSTSAPCPNCRQPLMRLLSLDLVDERVGLSGSGIGRLDLLFCWPCGVSQEPFYYRVRTGGDVHLVQAGQGPPEKDFPYEGYPRSFPEASARLQAMDADLHALVERYAVLAESGDEELDAWDLETKFRAATPRHQVGGVPFLYDYCPLNCPGCLLPMPFLATIADENTDPRGFVGNAYVQVVFFYCPLCRIVGARQESD